MHSGALFTAGRLDEALMLVTELLAEHPPLPALFGSALAKAAPPPPSPEAGS